MQQNTKMQGYIAIKIYTTQTYQILSGKVYPQGLFQKI